MFFSPEKNSFEASRSLDVLTPFNSLEWNPFPWFKLVVPFADLSEMISSPSLPPFFLRFLPGALFPLLPALIPDGFDFGSRN